MMRLPKRGTQLRVAAEHPRTLLGAPPNPGLWLCTLNWKSPGGGSACSAVTKAQRCLGKKKLRHREGKALSHPGRRRALGAGASSPAHLQLSLRNQRIACAKSLAGAKQDRVRQLRAAAGAAQSQTPALGTPQVMSPKSCRRCRLSHAPAAPARGWALQPFAFALGLEQKRPWPPDAHRHWPRPRTRPGAGSKFRAAPGAASWT